MTQGQVHEKGEPVTGQLGRPQGENTGKKDEIGVFGKKAGKPQKILKNYLKIAELFDFWGCLHGDNMVNG